MFRFRGWLRFRPRMFCRLGPKSPHRSPSILTPAPSHTHIGFCSEKNIRSLLYNDDVMAVLSPIYCAGIGLMTAPTVSLDPRFLPPPCIRNGFRTIQLSRPLSDSPRASRESGLTPPPGIRTHKLKNVRVEDSVVWQPGARGGDRARKAAHPKVRKSGGRDRSTVEPPVRTLFVGPSFRRKGEERGVRQTTGLVSHQWDDRRHVP